MFGGRGAGLSHICVYCLSGELEVPEVSLPVLPLDLPGELCAIGHDRRPHRLSAGVVRAQDQKIMAPLAMCCLPRMITQRGHHAIIMMPPPLVFSRMASRLNINTRYRRGGIRACNTSVFLGISGRHRGCSRPSWPRLLIWRVSRKHGHDGLCWVSRGSLARTSLECVSLEA